MACAVRMTYHHIHHELARQRAAEIERHPHPQPLAPPRDWAALAPVLSVLTGVAGLLAIAAPSL